MLATLSSKPFTVIDCEQRSEQWRQVKCGVFSASMAGEAFAKTAKGEYKADRRNLRTRLALERAIGQPLEDGYVSKFMRDGIDREKAALRAYENAQGALVRTVGFVLDNDAPIGCSPDGVIGDFEGIVQAKCPQATTHLATLRACAGVAAAIKMGLSADVQVRCQLEAVGEYVPQMRHEMFVTGAAWYEYCSYHPAFQSAKIVIVRLRREDIDLAGYAHDVKTFLSEVDQECEQIAEMMR